ncbi:hypothetical protein PSYJA_43366, partial [Pseudomonas syringae pv. japonica str. M301072]
TTHQIAAAIQAVTINEGAINESLGLLLRQVQIAAGDTGTAYVQLT